MRSVKLYTVGYLVAIVLLAVISSLIPDSEVIGASLSVTDSGEATVVLIGDLMRTVSTLDLALFAAVGTLAIKGNEWSGRWTHYDNILVLFSFICGVASLYAIYVGYTALISMVIKGYVSPFAVQLDWALRVMYYGLLCGFVISGIIFIRIVVSRA